MRSPSLIGIEDGVYLAPTLDEVIAARDAAWARLVKAQKPHLLAAYVGVPDIDFEAAEEELAAALQALRDLGVDVDRLLAGPEEKP